MFPFDETDASKGVLMFEGELMNRRLRLIFVAILLITCSGCFWVEGRGWHGDRDGGRHNGHEERH